MAKCGQAYDQSVEEALQKVNDFNILQYEDLENGKKFEEDIRNSDFSVTLSVRNPKAEFLILNKSQVEDIDFLQLVKVGKSFADFFDVSDLILSIHCGTWKSEPLEDKLEVKLSKFHHFHVHLSFGARKEKFLEIFKKIVTDSSANLWWNERCMRSLSDHWSFGTEAFPHLDLDERHKRNVLNNPYHPYKVIEFTIVKNITKKADGASKKNDIRDMFGDQYKIIYHPYQSQIGLACQEHTEWGPDVQKELVEDLERLARIVLENFATSNDDKGYHICISLSKTGFPEFCSTDGYRPVWGYIRVSGPVFSLCPGLQLNKWFKAYTKWNGIIYT